MTDREVTEERLLKYQGQLRALTLELALAEEEERRRIAHGLHGDVGHRLALAQIMLGSMDDAPDAPERLGEVRTLIAEAISATRLLTFELSSPVLYELGLEAALESLVERMTVATGVPFAFDSDGERTPMSRSTSVVLYRATRELLVNVAKHAHAEAATLAVSRTPDEVRISVADDGRGFDVEEVLGPLGPRTGFGLFGVREALRALGGRLEVQATPGEGTRCSMVAPLTADGGAARGRLPG